MARLVLASEEAWGLLNSVQKRVGGATSPGPTATSVSRLRIATGLLGRCSSFRIPGTGRARAKAFCARQRSEEHTSELQSLMRISYAVFCLNKKPHTHMS